jgi:hypothetical protein
MNQNKLMITLPKIILDKIIGYHKKLTDLKINYSFTYGTISLITDNFGFDINEFDPSYKGTDWLEDNFEIHFHHNDDLGYTYLIANYKDVQIYIWDANANQMYCKIDRYKCTSAFKLISTIWDKFVTMEHLGDNESVEHIESDIEIKTIT